MPTYEYRCRQCGHKFEKFQGMNDGLLEACPECGGHVERLIGAGAGLIFKGSGFYSTDYRTKGPKGDKLESSPDGEPGNGDKGKKGGAGNHEKGE